MSRRDSPEDPSSFDVLRSSEARFRTLIEKAPVAIAMNRDLENVYVNQRFAEMFGFGDPEEVLGRRLGELFAPECRAEVEARAGRRLRGLPADSEYEATALRRDGTRFPVHVAASLFELEEGWTSVAFLTDLTARRRAERDLCDAEKRFRSLIEGSRDAIVIMATDGTILFASPSAERLSGRRPEDLVGTNAFDLAHADDRPPLRARLAEVLRGAVGPVPIPMAFRMRQADGSWRRVEIVASNRSDNPSVGGLVVNFRDVTERHEVHASMQKLLLAVEQAANVIFMTDAEGSITYVNPAFEKTYGYSRDETIGKTPRMLKSNRHDRAFYKDLWRRLKAGERVSAEMVNLRKDGKPVTLDATITPVLEGGGRLVGFIAVQDDITEKKLLEEQFLQVQKMDAIGQLAGGVAHDFNNLLTAILGYSDLLLSRVPASGGMREELGEIRKAGDRAASLTRQLLAFSRRQVLEPKIVDVNSLIRNLEKMLGRLIPEDVRLSTVLDPALGSVRADPGQVEQVILNLALNARDAMPDGGTLVIETGNAELDEEWSRANPPAKAGRYVRIVIRDSGIGMSSEIKAHVFEPFFTTKERGKGTGLGLATVWGIVKQSGGHVCVESEPGAGTAFTVDLPRVSAAAPRMTPGVAAFPPRGTETVLLVEDEEPVRSLCAKILRSFGYAVLEADGPEAALSIVGVHSERIPLLLTDVVMPGMHGADLAAKLTELRPEMRVLFMSGYTDESVLRRGHIAEGGRFLQKPFTPAALAAKVREILDR